MNKLFLYLFKITEKFIHPEYDSPARANDVALLKLETPAVMGKTLSPACLPDQVVMTSKNLDRRINFKAICKRVTLETQAHSLRVLTVFLAGKSFWRCLASLGIQSWLSVGGSRLQGKGSQLMSLANLGDWEGVSFENRLWNGFWEGVCSENYFLMVYQVSCPWSLTRSVPRSISRFHVKTFFLHWKFL